MEKLVNTPKKYNSKPWVGYFSEGSSEFQSKHILYPKSSFTLIYYAQNFYTDHVNKNR